MNRFLKSKNLAVVLGALTIGFLLLLATGLDGLILLPGTPFSTVAEGDFGPYLPSVTFIFMMVGALAFFIIGIMLLLPWTRRQIKAVLLGFFVLLVALLIMMAAAMTAHQELPASLPTPIVEVVATPVLLEEEDVLVEPGVYVANQDFNEPPISPWFSFFLSLGIVLLVFLLVWVLFLRDRLDGADQRVILAEIAGQALDEIKAGKDWGDAILNCYGGMLQVVTDNKKMILDESLTPAEFVAFMVRARLPVGPVERLTALFERVRYGGKTASRGEIEEAMTCLADIVAACRGDS
jgi:hypothetical protein